MQDFSKEYRQRYHRQIIVKEIGEKGQRKLDRARVLVVGTGGLGSPVALYLAAAGIGTIGLVDDDRVEISNLQRQLLHSVDELGNKKVASARRRLKKLNPDLEVEIHSSRLERDNALETIEDYHLVVNAVDNFATRYLVNDACVLTKTPLVEAGIMGFDGQLISVIPGQGPCYRCLFPEAPSGNTLEQEIGVLGAVPGVIGSLQALEAIKIILDQGRPLAGRLLIFEGLQLTFQEIEIERDGDCAVCGENPTITDLRDNPSSHD